MTHAPAPPMVAGSLQSRLIRTAQAVLFRQGVQMIVQIGLIPLFLQAWTTARYGEWLLLSAIPAYLEYAKIGLAGATVNAMALAASRGDHDHVSRLFSSSVFVIGLIAAALVVLTAGAGASGVLQSWFHFKTISPPDAALTIVLLTAYMCGGQFLILFGGGLRAGGHNALAVGVNATSRLCEFAAIALALHWGRSAPSVATALLIVRIGSVAARGFCMQRQAPWLKLKVKAIQVSALGPLLPASFGYLWWGLGNALSLQGFALVVGLTLGPTALVAFSTIRTMTRVMLQCVMAMHDVITPETSLSFGAGDISTFRRLHNVSCQLALWTAGLVTVVAIPLAPLTHHLWTLGRVPFDLPTFAFLMLAVTFQSLWSTSSVTLSAINRHMAVSSVFLVANIIGVGLGSQFIRPFGIHAISALIMVIDGGFAVYVLANVLPVVHERFSTFLKSIFTPPLFLLSWRNLRSGV